MNPDNELIRCKVLTNDGEDREDDASSNAYLYQSRIDILRHRLPSGQVMSVSKSDLQRKSFGSIGYGKTLNSVQEVLLNLKDLEASAKISLPPSDGTYICDPRWLDAFIQLASLIVNYEHGCNDKARLAWHGWDKMQFLLPFEPHVVYRVHVRMQPGKRTGHMIGDVNVLDGAGRAAMVIKEIRFKASLGIEPKQVLESIAINSDKRSSLEIANDASANKFQHCEFPANNDTFVANSQIPDFSQAKLNGGAAHSVDRHDGAMENEALNQSSINIADPPRPASEQLSNEVPTNGSNNSTVDFDQILGLLADEIGVEPDSLKDSTLLEELGVDSIIQMSLVTRIQDLVPQQLPPRMLIDFNSIGQLRKFFATQLTSSDLRSSSET